VQLIVALVGIVFIVWLAYVMGRGTSRREGVSVARVPEAGPEMSWEFHRDPAGFLIETPRDWTIGLESTTGRVDVQGGDGVQVLLWPVWITSPVDEALATRILQDLSDRMLHDIEWKSVPSEVDGAVRLSGSSSEADALTLLIWKTQPNGTTAMAVGMKTRSGGFESHESDFARILGSFRVFGLPALTGSSLAYSSWGDPNEGAFAVEVPNGWKTSGSLTRSSSGTPRPAIDVVSPDGRVQIRIGDPGLPDHIVPDPILLARGLVEGSTYTDDSGRRYMLRRYVAAPELAADYVKMSVCPEPVFKEVNSRMELAEDVRKTLKQGGVMSTRVSAGEAAYTCSTDGVLHCGYGFAVTILNPSEIGGGQWAVPFLCLMHSTPDRLDMALAVLNRMLTTLHFKREWWSSQERLVSIDPAVFSAVWGEISEQAAASYWSQNRPKSIAGTERGAVVTAIDDPGFARQIQVMVAPDHFWIDANGKLVGSDADALPATDFSLLVKRP